MQVKTGASHWLEGMSLVVTGRKPATAVFKK
jgi:hypothetical protein